MRLAAGRQGAARVAIRELGLLPTRLSIISIEEGVKLISTDGEESLQPLSPTFTERLRATGTGASPFPDKHLSP